MADPAAGSELFTVRDLVKIFPGAEGPVRAIGGISLNVHAGECLIIAGANGSGKTILVRMLIGLLDPSSGEILFRGKALDQSIRREAGLVFQEAETQIIGETAAEDISFGPKNLGFSKDEIAARIEDALEAMDLGAKRNFSPRRLSGGEKRRLAVAGILAMGCTTLILDEPFANLDWPGVVQVLRIIRRLKDSGKTVIILTHELEKTLAFADRLIILYRGLIQDEGKPAAVLDRLKPEYGVRDPRQSYASVEDCTWLD